LLQFLLASDRGNPRVSERYDALSPGVLRALGEIAREAERHRVPVGVCGELAGEPLGAMALVGLGFRSLSMNPAGIGPVRAMLRSLDLGPLQELLRRKLENPEHSLRPILRAFARDRHVQV